MYTSKFLFVGFVVTEIRLFNLQPEEEEAEEDEEHGNSVKIKITCIIPVLREFLDFFHVCDKPHFLSSLSMMSSCLCT